MALADRLKLALSEKGVSQNAVARHLGITSASVSHWFSGRTKNLRSEYLSSLSEFLGVSPIWLATGKGLMHGEEIRTVDPTEEGVPDGYVCIEEYELKAAAGSKEYGYSVVHPEVSQSAIYRRDWFIKKRINPEKCKRFRVDGDSMLPTLCDGDRVLVDTSPQPIISGKVYLFMVDYEPRIKRLYRQINGDILIHSDNEDFPEETLPNEQLDRFVLIGRVIERSGSSGL